MTMLSLLVSCEPEENETCNPIYNSDWEIIGYNCNN